MRQHTCTFLPPALTKNEERSFKKPRPITMVCMFKQFLNQITTCINGKCSKISNTFLFLFSNKALVFRAGIHKMLVRMANWEDPDHTASSEALRSGSALHV